MTRINVGVRAKELSRQHLIAEHREIKRIPNQIKNGRYSMEKQPNEFTLGTGHVKFFYDKLKYLYNRYVEIYCECVDRGYNVSDYSNCWDNVPKHLFNDYKEQKRDRLLILERIRERNKK
jgi:hypothetical protein